MVMLIYLDQAWNQIKAERQAEGRPAQRCGSLSRHHGRRGRAGATQDDDRGRHRRPACAHHVVDRHGSVMSRIAAPMVGGMISSTVLTLGDPGALCAGQAIGAWNGAWKRLCRCHGSPPIAPAH